MSTRNLALFQVLVSSSIFLLILPHISCDDEPNLEHCGFDSIYNFGTSMSDTGNIIIQVPVAPAARLPYGRAIGKATGRHSDGYLMIDFIAKSANLPYIEPYLRKETHTNGVNFAAAGAPTLPSNVLKEMEIDCPSFMNNYFDKQFGWLEEYLKGYCHDTEDCQKKLESSLIVSDFGVNDYSYALTSHTVEDIKKLDLVTKVVKAINTTIEKLIHRGARNFLILGTYPLGCSPQFLAPQASNETASYDEFHCLKDYNDFIMGANDDLIKGLGELRDKYPNERIVYGDLFKAFEWVFHNQESHGYKESTKACCGPINKYNYKDSKNENACGAKGIPVCSKPEEYIFWDGAHWTQKTHELVATKLIEDSLPQFQCNA